MIKPNNDARGNIAAALWSGIIALWRAGARRPAWPLLLALLLLVGAPLAAPLDCALEMGGHSHEGASAASHHAIENGEHRAQIAGKGAILLAPEVCCCCFSEPVNATVAEISAPHQPKADSHAVIYRVARLLPVYRFDALCGLHTRAGPPTGKPQRLALVSHIGPAPPISL